MLCEPVIDLLAKVEKLTGLLREAQPWIHEAWYESSIGDDEAAEDLQARIREAIGEP